MCVFFNKNIYLPTNTKELFLLLQSDSTQTYVCAKLERLVFLFCFSKQIKPQKSTRESNFTCQRKIILPYVPVHDFVPVAIETERGLGFGNSKLLSWVADSDIGVIRRIRIVNVITYIRYSLKILKLSRIHSKHLFQNPLITLMHSL